MRVSATIGVVVCLLSSGGCQREPRIDKAISDRIDQRIEEALAPEKAEIAALKKTVEGLDRRLSEIEARGPGGMGSGMMGSGMGPGMMQGPPASTAPTPSETPKQ